MSAYITILRPLNGIMGAVAVWIGSLVAGAALAPSIDIALGMLAVFLISGGGMVVNDYADADIDRINRPKRPIPSGKISRSAALVYAVILFFAGLVAALNIHETAFSVAAIAAALLIAYSAKLKGVMMLGHVIVSFLVALTFLYGGFIAGSIDAIVPLAILAFLSNMGREIFKTIDDIMGDRHKRIKTTAIRYGVVNAKRLASLFIIIAVAYSFVPYLQNQFNVIYLFFVVIADIIFLAAVAANVRHGSKLTKLAMLVALVAFVAGAVTA